MFPILHPFNHYIIYPYILDIMEKFFEIQVLVDPLMHMINFSQDSANFLDYPFPDLKEFAN